MAKFTKIIKFLSENNSIYWAEFPEDGGLDLLSQSGSKVVLEAYKSIEDLQANSTTREKVAVKEILAPVPDPTIPIYCVGANFKSHIKEANLVTPKYPPLWTKPATCLAQHQEQIPLSQYLATSLPDYEGELVFITSRDCKNISPKDADSYILGYTVGNDLSCRFFQLQNNCAGQFFYAKAFDKFAPMGPVLVSPEQYNATAKGRRLRTKVNGRIMQDADLAADMVFNPSQILSHMSQGTVVMTGTPEGVGAFQNPKYFLHDGDVVEIDIDGIGTLRNTIRFEQ